MRVLNCALNILRIVVTTIDDNQVFVPTCYEQHIILKKPHISSAQKWSSSRVCQVCLEGTLSLLCFVPVSLSNARTCNPNLSYLASCTRGHRFGIDDEYSLIWRHQLISYEFPSILIFFRSANCPIMLNCRSLKCSDHRWISPCTSCRDERRLCKSIGSKKGLPAETTSSKDLYKSVQRLITDRLGTIRSHLPATQIKHRTLLSSNLACA